MSENINQFALYAAKIFELLYDSFPIPLPLDKNHIILEYLNFDKNEELNKLKMKEEFSKILDHTDLEELKMKAKDELPATQDKIAELERIKHFDKNLQIKIYEGTLIFLISEAIISESEFGKYQLTSKGFLHLNKSFKNGSITNEDSTNISILKNIFKKSGDTSLQVATGIAVNVITKMMNYS